MAVRLPTKRFRGCFGDIGEGSGDSGVGCGIPSDSVISVEAMAKTPIMSKESYELSLKPDNGRSRGKPDRRKAGSRTRSLQDAWAV